MHISGIEPPALKIPVLYKNLNSTLRYCVHHARGRKPSSPAVVAVGVSWCGQSANSAELSAAPKLLPAP